jgi:hypothetical protein
VGSGKAQKAVDDAAVRLLIKKKAQQDADEVKK